MDKSMNLKRMQIFTQFEEDTKKLKISFQISHFQSLAFNLWRFP
jgi:hypothetical protein